MDYEIEWTEDAREDYRAIASHLLDHYGFEVANRFTDTVAHKIGLLEKTPFIGRKLESLPSIRKFPAEPYTMIYYLVAGGRVIILNLLDTRRSIP